MENFSPPQFLADVERTCKAINAPYSESMTHSVLSAFAQGFREGAVLWRTTDRPGDALNYRFYERQPTDTIRTAVEAGLLEPGNKLAELLTSWSKPWGTGRKYVVPEQSCDFDAEKGLTKVWVFMGGPRPFDDIISVENVPACVTMYRETFHSLRLTTARHVAVDFDANTINIYFRAPGPLTEDQALSFVRLAGHSSLPDSEFAEMRKFLSPMGFTFAVTIAVPSGDIKRVAFYALGLPENMFPAMAPRMATFFAEAPNYDAEKFTAVAWSYGAGGDKYMKAEQSCCGQVVSLVKDWKSNLALDELAD